MFKYFRNTDCLHVKSHRPIVLVIVVGIEILIVIVIIIIFKWSKGRGIPSEENDLLKKDNGH